MIFVPHLPLKSEGESMQCLLLPVVLASCLMVSARAGEKDGRETPPPGFVSLFNGKDLTGWKNTTAWDVEANTIHYTGKGRQPRHRQELQGLRAVGRLEDHPKGDSASICAANRRCKSGNPEGSGGLYNNPPKATARNRSSAQEYDR